MRKSTILIVTIMIAVVTIAIGIIASESAQYQNPITVDSGKAMIVTDNGAQAYTDVEYITGHVVSVKAMAILTIDSAPSTLPNTSSANGSITCTLSSHGVSFTVTGNTPCDSR